MTIKKGATVERIENRPQVLASVLQLVDGPMGTIAELSYAEGGSGWWPVECLRVTNDPTP